jgi:hypothetical protein
VLKKGDVSTESGSPHASLGAVSSDMEMPGIAYRSEAQFMSSYPMSIGTAQ